MVHYCNMASGSIMLDKIQDIHTQNNINEKFLDYIIDHVISKRRPFIRPFVRLLFDVLIGFMVFSLFVHRMAVRNWHLMLTGLVIYSIMELNKYRRQLGSDEELTV